MSTRRAAGQRLVYVTRWCGRDTAEYARSDAQWREELLGVLGAWVEAGGDAVDSAPLVWEAEGLAVWPLGSARRVSRPEVVGAPLFLCGPAQAYPRTPDWESAVVSARLAVESATRCVRGSVEPAAR